MTGQTALMQFPGIVGVISGSYSLGLGVSPSFAQIEVPPYTRIPREVGDLILTAPPNFYLRLTKCRVVKATTTNSDTLVFTIADRRWMWRFGFVFLLANERAKDGTIKPGTEKSPQQLARFLLDEMGERNVDVSALPDETRPEIQWNGASPAAELESLCGSLGCAVAFWQDRVSIVRLGEGGRLPENPLKDGQGALDVPFIPDAVQTISGPGDFQAMFQLEAVAEKKDGSLVPIDDAPYKPEGGWEKEDPAEFEGVEDDKDRELALKSVFRKYRIQWEISGSEGKILDGGQFGFGAETRISKLDQILPLFDDLIETEQLPDRSVRPKPAYVEGKHYLGDDAYENKYTKVKTSFSLDAERGVVDFSDPVYLLKRESGSDVNKPAEIYLVARCNVKQPGTNQPWRYQFTVPTGGQQWGTKNHAELRFDLIPKARARYSEGTDEEPPELEEVIRNTEELEADLREHCQAVISGMRWTPGEQRNWVGWFANFQLDGALRSVTWSFGADGFYTAVSWNTEASEFVSDTLAERKALEEARHRNKEKASFGELSRRSKIK